MAHQRHFQMGGGSAQFGDTTYTKIFVGGLAWETQRDTMRHYFEQFGEIQEAAVITDKSTGRSKGYGFVTFKDPEAARRACQDPNPVIDGRRANCNLAAFGSSSHHRSRPPSPHQAFGRFRAVVGSSTAAAYHNPSAPVATGFYQQPAQYAFPYNVFGYSGSGGYSENMLPMSYYNVPGGAGGQYHQFPPYYAGATAGGGFYHNLYPYYAQYMQSGHGGATSGYGLQYPQHLQYSYFPQQYTTGILPMPASVAVTSGITTIAVAAASGGPSSSLQPATALQRSPGLNGLIG